jgi:hypothetical protein
MTPTEQTSTTNRRCESCAHWVCLASPAAPTLVLVELDPDPDSRVIGHVVRRLGDCLITMTQVWCDRRGCHLWRGGLR